MRKTECSAPGCTHTKAKPTVSYCRCCRAAYEREARAAGLRKNYYVPHPRKTGFELAVELEAAENPQRGWVVGSEEPLPLTHYFPMS